MNSALAKAFTEQAARHLQSDFLAKIRVCLEHLSEEDLWWRPNEHSNSVGNLLLHLCGNVRQWIQAGVGGEPDIRKRDTEFSTRQPVAKAELLQNLEKTVSEASAIIRRLGEEELLRPRRIQIYDVSALQAVFHVVEHFSYHTGQVIYVTKLRRDVDLQFYPELNDKKKRFEDISAW